ncbi:MAG: alpha/beta hydrolase [Pirellulaceae bacterium]
MPLILLHGFPLDHRLWLQQIDYLSKNYYIIAPDLRGFGQSTLTEEPYSMADLAEDVEQVRQHMTDDQPVALCGLSMGGYVAFEYWRHYSKSLTALILANTKPEEDTDQGRAARRAMSERAHQLGVGTRFLKCSPSCYRNSILLNLARSFKLPSRCFGLARPMPSQVLSGRWPIAPILSPCSQP